MDPAKIIMLYLLGAGLCMGANINIMSTTVQDEGNACFDMAAAMPGLKSIPCKNNHVRILESSINITVTG